MGTILATNEKNTVMETNEKANEILNDLIRINHDRARVKKLLGNYLIRIQI